MSLLYRVGFASAIFICGTQTLSQELPQTFNGEAQCEQTSNSKRETDVLEPSWKCYFQSHVNSKDGNADAGKQHPIGIFQPLLQWSWQWFTRLRDDPIALFTLMLSIFTVGLYGETRGLRRAAVQQQMDTADSIKIARDSAQAAIRNADAAILQASAAIAANDAEILVADMWLVRYPDPPINQQDTVLPPGPLPKQFRASVVMHNFGRTNSILSEYCVEWIVMKRRIGSPNIDPPPAPIYTHIAKVFMGFSGGQTIAMKWSESENGLIELTDSQVAEIASNNAWLWVYGYYKFTNFLGDTYIVGFAAHWEAIAGGTHPNLNLSSPRGFVREGPQAYVYRNKISQKPS